MSLLRYAVDAIVLLWAAFGVLEICAFLFGGFIADTTDEEDERLI